MLAAQNDDWKAYDQLLKWAKDSSHPLFKVALNATIKIRTSYAGPISPGHLNISWKKNINPNDLSFNRIKQNFYNLEPVLHADLVQLMWKREDILKIEKMSFFIEVVETSNSLTAKHDAARYFIKLADDSGLKWEPFKIDPLLEWWKKNKSNIK